MKKNKIKIRKKNSDDLVKKMGVFISYSHQNKEEEDSKFFRLTNLFDENCISYLCDEGFNVGENFYNRIQEYVEYATGGVVLATKDAFKSPWVYYEIGMLEGGNKSIVLYCEDEKELKEIPTVMKKYPLVTNPLELIETVKSYSMFNDLYENDTAIMTKDIYNKELKDKIESYIIEIDISSYLQDLIRENKIKFGCIIVALCKYGYLINQSKYHDYECNIKCGENIEGLILNKLLFHTRLKGGRIEIAVPVHSDNGVMLKCFVDVSNSSYKRLVMNELKDIGMKDVSYSGSATEHRIYFLIPTMSKKNLFEIASKNSGIVNNFIEPIK